MAAPTKATNETVPLESEWMSSVVPIRISSYTLANEEKTHTQTQRMRLLFSFENNTYRFVFICAGVDVVLHFNCFVHTYLARARLDVEWLVGLLPIYTQWPRVRPKHIQILQPFVRRHPNHTHAHTKTRRKPYGILIHRILIWYELILNFFFSFFVSVRNRSFNSHKAILLLLLRLLWLLFLVNGFRRLLAANKHNGFEQTKMKKKKRKNYVDQPLRRENAEWYRTIIAASLFFAGALDTADDDEAYKLYDLLHFSCELWMEHT